MPTGGTPSYTFDWSNSETSEDLIDLAADIYSVIITDANGCELTINDIIVDFIAGINSVATKISVSPNPTNGIVTVSLPELVNANLTVSDISGKLLKNYSISNTQKSVSIDLSDLNSGLYFVKIISGQNTYNQTVVKK